MGLFCAIVSAFAVCSAAVVVVVGHVVLLPLLFSLLTMPNSPDFASCHFLVVHLGEEAEELRTFHQIHFVVLCVGVHHAVLPFRLPKKIVPVYFHAGSLL